MRHILLLAALTAIPVVAGAQGTRAEEEKNSSSVPVNMLPPAGKCRIWMVGVAPAQQPAPTDCQTALRQRTPNGVVIFGPTEREQGGSAFRGRPTVEQGRNDRPRTNDLREPTRDPSRETLREPSREAGAAAATRERLTEPSRAPASAPVRAETRAPANEPRREAPPSPPSGTARPTQDPVKKPGSDQPVAYCAFGALSPSTLAGLAS